jgi:Raf kinase inhibitor-like YbhB/YbcL family protein
MSFIFREPTLTADRPQSSRVNRPVMGKVPLQPNRQVFTLTSPAFIDGEDLPRIYNRLGSALSPPLRWSGVPTGAVSLVLLLEAPMAPGEVWLHWALYDIPANLSGLPAGIEASPYLANGARHGLSWGRHSFEGIGYQAPDPTQGRPEGYRFTLSALDGLLYLPAGASGRDLRAAMKHRLLAETTLQTLPPVLCGCP